MSITKDFEEKAFDIDNWNRGFIESDVKALLAHARALEAMLKKHRRDPWNEECPECGAYGECEPGCEIDRLLMEV